LTQNYGAQLDVTLNAEEYASSSIAAGAVSGVVALKIGDLKSRPKKRNLPKDFPFIIRHELRRWAIYSATRSPGSFGALAPTTLQNGIPVAVYTPLIARPSLPDPGLTNSARILASTAKEPLWFKHRWKCPKGARIPAEPRVAEYKKRGLVVYDIAPRPEAGSNACLLEISTRLVSKEETQATLTVQEILTSH
jgi:hypothetical protein